MLSIDTKNIYLAQYCEAKISLIANRSTEHHIHVADLVVTAKDGQKESTLESKTARMASY